MRLLSIIISAIQNIHIIKLLTEINYYNTKSTQNKEALCSVF